MEGVGNDSGGGSITAQSSKSSKEGDVLKKGKKHPPPPKLRPPLVNEEKETKVPATTFDFECSTSEDEDASIRRAPPRQSKKQKRAQKSLEMKEDRTVLREMKNPLPSTSGPLVREQDKIKRMHPKKFLPIETKHPQSCISGVTNGVETPLLSERNLRGGSKPTTANIEVEKKIGAMRKSAKVAGNENAVERRSVLRPTRSSFRRSVIVVELNVETGKDDDNKSAENMNEKITSPAKSVENLNAAKEKVSFDSVKCHLNGNGNPSPKPTKRVSTPLTKRTSARPTKRVSTPSQSQEPVLKEKRQRKLSKRLTSPDMGDLPPLLFRIASTGGINNISDDEEPPPTLKPMISPNKTPIVILPRKLPGKENKFIVAEEKTRASASKRPIPIPQDCGQESDEATDKTEGGREPARKRIARTQAASSGTDESPQQNAITTTSNSPKPPDQPNRRTPSSRKAKVSTNNT